MFTYHKPTQKKLMDPDVLRITADLKRLGADSYDMHLPETHRLSRLVRPGEQIQGVVYGRYSYEDQSGQSARRLIHGRGALLVTDHRILFLDKKPSFIHYDEIPLDLISGITYTRAGFGGTVTLRTKTGDYALRTFNQRCAANFVEAIENARFAIQDQSTNHT